MKLTKKEAGEFYNIVSTAVLAGLEQIVFQDGKIGVASGIQRGVSAIIAKNGIPFPMKMGLTRLSVLKKRLDLLISNDQFEITPKESDRGEIVQLEMAAGKTKTQYRCTSTVGIHSPAEINDGGMLGLLTISKEELAMILSGARAMSAANLLLIVKQDGTASFESTDSNDRFNVELEKPIERVDESDSSVFSYETGIFSNLLRASLGGGDSLTLAVGISGTIQFELNNCELSIFAQVDGADND